MNAWKFQRAVTQRLAAWAGLNVLAGILLNLLRDPLWKGIGMQCAGWGLVNTAIALIGGRSAAERQAALPDPLDAAVQQKESANLERLLWINTALDILYVAGGTALAASKGRKDRRLAGHGLGVLIQGAFLFFFDLFHAAVLRQSGASRRDILL